MAANNYKGKKRSGTLFRRKNGERYDLHDPAAKNAAIYLRYKVDGKSFTLSMKTSDAAKAERQRDAVMAPLRVADKQEALRQQQVRLIEADEEAFELSRNEDSGLSFENAWATYTGPAFAPDCGKETLNRYKSHFDGFVKWLANHYPEISKLNEVTSEIALDYSAYLNRKYSPNTFNKYKNFLFSFYKTLEKPAAMQANPWHKDLIKRKRLTGKTNSKRELTIDELKSILEKAEGEELTFHALGIFTGMRLGDCATLKWSEVDLDRRIIVRIPNKTKHTSGEKIKIGIPPYLHALLSTTPKAKRKGHVLADTSMLYETDPAALSRQIQDLFEKCGINTVQPGTGKGTKKRAIVEVGFHSYRHTYVSLNAMAGTPTAHVQQLVGHSNPAMTEHYTHISDAAVVKYAQALPDPTVNKMKATDAEFEVVEEKVVPPWIKDDLKKQTAGNWESIRDELVGK